MSDSKDKEIQKLERKLTSILKKKLADDDKLKIAGELIKDVAFMINRTDDLKQEIKKNGMIEEYQNGANQWGRKKSAAVDIYLNMTKQKAALIKQLCDLLPEVTTNGTLDEFDEFLKGRRE